MKRLIIVAISSFILTLSFSECDNVPEKGSGKLFIIENKKDKKDKKKNITCFKYKKVVTIITNVLMMVKKKARTGQAF